MSACPLALAQPPDASLILSLAALQQPSPLAAHRARRALLGRLRASPSASALAALLTALVEWAAAPSGLRETAGMEAACLLADAVRLLAGEPRAAADLRAVLYQGLARLLAALAALPPASLLRFPVLRALCRLAKLPGPDPPPPVPPLAALLAQALAAPPPPAAGVAVAWKWTRLFRAALAGAALPDAQAEALLAALRPALATSLSLSLSLSAAPAPPPTPWEAPPPASCLPLVMLAPLAPALLACCSASSAHLVLAQLAPLLPDPATGPTLPDAETVASALAAVGDDELVAALDALLRLRVRAESERWAVLPGGLGAWWAALLARWSALDPHACFAAMAGLGAQARAAPALASAPAQPEALPLELLLGADAPSFLACLLRYLRWTAAVEPLRPPALLDPRRAAALRLLVALRAGVGRAHRRGLLPFNAAPLLTRLDAALGPAKGAS